MIEQLIHRIEVRQAELRMSLATGVPATWEAYQRMTGEYQGLQSVLDILQNMLEERDEQD